jgi:choline dehydrogenase-like flavoprotein
MKLWGAEAVGGTTRINAMLFTRGAPGGYNEWAESFGLDDWGWDKVEPFFKKSENAVAHPDAPHRGHSGPIETRQPGPWLSSIPYYEKAAKAVGLPVERDLNDPKASAQGFFYLDQTIDAKSRRLSAYRAWLNANIAIERKDRLSVCTGVVASRLEIDPRGKRVTGVHLQHARRSSMDKEYFVKARREVIICSGTVCTPQLLMLRYETEYRSFASSVLISD